MEGNYAFCTNCGASINSEDAYCEQCGQVKENSTVLKVKLQWDVNIPTTDLLWGAGKVLALAFGFVLVLLEIIMQFSGESFVIEIARSMDSNDPYLYYAGGFIAFWLLLSAAFTWAIYGRGYEATFGVEEEGVWMETRPGTRKVNRIVNCLLFWLSLFSQRPGGMGTAILANASQSAAFEWEDIYRVVPNPGHHVITLKNNWRALVRLYCTPANYAAVLQLVEKYVKKHAPQRVEKAKDSPGAGTYARKLFGPLAVIAGTVLVCQSPLLPDKTGVVMLTIVALLGCITGGPVRRNITYVTGAVLLGLAISMAINAFEPLGDYYIRYYRYDRLERMPEIAEFVVSMAGMILHAVLAWGNARTNHQIQGG